MQNLVALRHTIWAYVGDFQKFGAVGAPSLWLGREDVQLASVCSVQLARITGGGRYALHLQRSLAMLNAASADSP